MEKRREAVRQSYRPDSTPKHSPPYTEPRGSVFSLARMQLVLITESINTRTGLLKGGNV
jgi:hypothetical protein